MFGPAFHPRDEQILADPSVRDHARASHELARHRAPDAAQVLFREAAVMRGVLTFIRE